MEYLPEPAGDSPYFEVAGFFQCFIHSELKTSEKKGDKIFPIINFPYLCLPKKQG